MEEDQRLFLNKDDVKEFIQDNDLKKEDIIDLSFWHLGKVDDHVGIYRLKYKIIKN